MTFLLVLMQSTKSTIPESFWPVTGAGWVALVASVLALLGALIGGLWSYFKVVEQIDGAGKRIKVLEEWKTQEEGRELEKTLAYERMANAQESLLREIGRATTEAHQCGIDTEAMGRQIGEKIELFMTEFRRSDRDTRDRLTRLETLIERDTRRQ